MKQKQTYLTLRALILSAFFACLQSLTFGQQQIELVHSDEFVSSTEFPGAGKLKGNVHFKTGNKNMYCDSAYFHKTENWIRAYSRVQINQADTLNLFCDSLYFDGNTNIGILRSNVRFRDNEFKMTTDSLEFDANQSMGYYTNWAVINSINQDLNLTSKEGYYYAQSKTFFFKDSVEVTHPNYHLSADTLEFNTNTQTVYFHGPTIITFDSTIVHCKKGYYDTQNELLNLWNGATIFQNSSTTIYADSLIYEQVNDIAYGYQNVSIYDSTENIQLKSNYLFKSPNNLKITLADNARIYKYTNKDTLILKADTIYQQKDSLTELTTNIAIFSVEIFQGDIVGVCDSIYYSEQDSIIKMRKNPIIWRELTQLSADSIDAVMINNEIEKLQLFNHSFVATQHDSSHYDQISGKHIIAYLDSSKIKKIEVLDLAQTIYYPVDTKKDSLGNEIKTLMGKNQMLSEYITILFLNSDINQIKFVKQVEASFYPINQIPEKELFLPNFKWEIERKPLVVFPK